MLMRTVAATPSPTPRHAKRRRAYPWTLTVSLSVVIACLIGAGFLTAAIVGQLASPPPDPAAVDHPYYPEPAPGEDPVAASQSQNDGDAYVPPPPIIGQPLHLDIPAVGLSADVGSMSVPGDRSIDPPTPGSAYWLDDYSTVGPDATGTAYIAGHTYRGTGSAVFNAFFNLDTREPIIKAGDLVHITVPEGVYAYVVTSVVDVNKVDVPQLSELWQNVPGRLVIVGCQYNGDSSAVQNLVVYTQLVQP